jgi:hypothetical protein
MAKNFSTEGVPQAQRAGRADRAVPQPDPLGRESVGRGRSSVADLYDDILFHGATFDDLQKVGGLDRGERDQARDGSSSTLIDVLCAELARSACRGRGRPSAVPVCRR